MSSAVVNILLLPEDVWGNLLNFASLRVAFILYSTCRTLHERYRTIIQDVIIPSELGRMGFTSSPSLRDRLSMDFVANFWWQRTPEERRVIRANILARPLEWYDRLQPATVVLEEDVSQASDDPEALFNLVGEHTDDRALILSHRVLFLGASNNHQYLIEGMKDRDNAFFCPLPTFPNLVIEAIAGIIGWAPHFEEALPALLRLRMGLRRREVSLPDAIDIIDRFVREPGVRDSILNQLVLEEVEPGRRLETSIEIALKIKDRGKRMKTIRALVLQALKKFPLDEILKKIQAISEDHRDDRDECIFTLLKRNPALDPKTATAMASAISNTTLQKDALKLLAQRKASSGKNS